MLKCSLIFCQILAHTNLILPILKSATSTSLYRENFLGLSTSLSSSLDTKQRLVIKSIIASASKWTLLCIIRSILLKSMYCTINSEFYIKAYSLSAFLLIAEEVLLFFYLVLKNSESFLAPVPNTCI